MASEFEFTAFAEKYTNSLDGFVELSQTLEGGWLGIKELDDRMSRLKYMLLKNDVHVKKVLFELGLLTVKRIDVDRNEVLLGSPNWMVTENALKVLVDETQQGITPEHLADFYLSDDKDGFGFIVSKAAKAVTNLFRGTEIDVIREYPFQDSLYMQLFSRFPADKASVAPYKLYKEHAVAITSAYGKAFRADGTSVEPNSPQVEGEARCVDNEMSQEMPSKTAPKTLLKGKGFGILDIALELFYPNRPKKIFMIEVKLSKLESGESAKIKKEHGKNIRFGEKQIKSYFWKQSTVEQVQKVVVSGVWHPSRSGSDMYELSTHVKFCSERSLKIPAR